MICAPPGTFQHRICFNGKLLEVYRPSKLCSFLINYDYTRSLKFCSVIGIYAQLTIAKKMADCRLYRDLLQKVNFICSRTVIRLIF